MTHADRDHPEDRRQITRTRFGSWECPTCHTRDAFILDGDTATCDNCRRIADLPEPLDYATRDDLVISRVGPHIDPDISPEDAAELMKAYDHTLDPAKIDPPLTISRSDPIFGGAFDPPAPDADRVNAYAEAIRRAWEGPAMDWIQAAAHAVVTIADREQATLLAKVAELEAEVERWTEKAQESGAAYANANTKHHAEWNRANRLERLADTLAGKAVDLEDRARAADAKVAELEAENVARLDLASQQMRRAEAAERALRPRLWVCDNCMASVTRRQIADMADGEHVLCKRCAGAR